MSWNFRRWVGCDREPAHRGVLGRADIPDIDPPSILALLDSQSLRTSREYGINHLGARGGGDRPEQVGAERL
jgi:hypothetical protein